MKNKSLKNIVLLGLVSCFADISSEMVYPIIPIYLTAVLGATPALVGLIEGIAESVAALLKVFSGYISDRFQKKKLLAFSGYATGVIYKFALVFAGSWLGILTARVIDRFGKGIRTAPRDAMIAESSLSASMGKSFGIHKMLDMAGSAVGILLAFVLLTSFGGENYKMIFIVSVIPVIIALLLFCFIKEKKTDISITHNREPFWKNAKNLDVRLKQYLAISFVFTLGNSSNSFILLRAYDVGFSTSTAILLYLIYNVASSVLAIPCGKLSDKIGRKKLMVCGYFVFSLVYFGIAFCTNKELLVMIFILYGVYTAMTAGVERAFIAEIAPKNLKGTMLGLQSTLTGIALFPASVIAGLLWNHIGACAPFVYGGVMSLVAAIVMVKWLSPKSKCNL